MRALPLVLALAACSSTPNAPPPADASVTDVVTATDVVTPRDVVTGAFTEVALRSDAPERAFTEPEMVLVAGQDYRAVMVTDVGRIVLDLYEDRTMRPTSVTITAR